MRLWGGIDFDAAVWVAEAAYPTTAALARPEGIPVDPAKPMLTKSEAAAALLARPIVRVKLLFVLASLVSLVLSVSLWFSGHEEQGIFVGLWVPSILSAGALLLSGRSEDE